MITIIKFSKTIDEDKDYGNHQMKGCLDIFIKSSTFFASYIVFQVIIGNLIWGEPPLLKEKQFKDMTIVERLEVSQYHEKFKISYLISGFLSLPLSAISTYLIFRNRTKN